MTTKICSKCGGDLSLAEFPVRNGKPISHCRSCESAYQAAYREKNRDAILRGKREHYERNKEAHAKSGALRRVAKAEEIAAKKREYYQRTREEAIARSRARYAEKRDEILAKQRQYNRLKSEHIKARSKAYIAARPDFLARMHAIRSRAEQQAVAGWDSELTELVSGEAARLCRLRSQLLGGDWHIDHQIPLQGKIVSGLHVWNNLAVVPASFNRSKKNKFDESLMGMAWL